MSKKKQDDQALKEAREAEFKAKLSSMSLEEVLEMHPRLKKEIKSSQASGKVEVKSGVILDKDDLDPKKKYVTGPNGRGFVEA